MTSDITINPAPEPGPPGAVYLRYIQQLEDENTQLRNTIQGLGSEVGAAAAVTLQKTDNYDAADSSRVRQLAAEITQLRDTIEALQQQPDNQDVTEETVRLRDTVVAQADTITALEEEAKERELFIEQLYSVADVLIHGRRR